MARFRLRSLGVLVLVLGHQAVAGDTATWIETVCRDHPLVRIAPVDAALLDRSAVAAIPADAEADAVAQAMAWALDGWWVVDGDGRRRLCVEPQRMRGQREAVVVRVATVHPRETLAIAQELMRPWLETGHAVSDQVVPASWSARLDPAGARRLQAVALALTVTVADLPPWVADPAWIDVPPSEPRPATWVEWADQMSRRLGAPVAVAPAVVATHGDPPAAGLAAAGLQASSHHGAWCVGVASAASRGDPVGGHQLAVLPIATWLPPPPAPGLPAIPNAEAWMAGAVARLRQAHPGVGIHAIPGRLAVVVDGAPADLHAVAATIGQGEATMPAAP